MWEVRGRELESAFLDDLQMLNNHEKSLQRHISATFAAERKKRQLQFNFDLLSVALFCEHSPEKEGKQNKDKEESKNNPPLDGGKRRYELTSSVFTAAREWIDSLLPERRIVIENCSASVKRAGLTFVMVGVEFRDKHSTPVPVYTPISSFCLMINGEKGFVSVPSLFATQEASTASAIFPGFPFASQSKTIEYAEIRIAESNTHLKFERLAIEPMVDRTALARMICDVPCVPCCFIGGIVLLKYGNEDINKIRLMPWSEGISHVKVHTLPTLQLLRKFPEDVAWRINNQQKQLYVFEESSRRLFVFKIVQKRSSPFSLSVRAIEKRCISLPFGSPFSFVGNSWLGCQKNTLIIRPAPKEKVYQVSLDTMKTTEEWDNARFTSDGTLITNHSLHGLTVSEDLESFIQGVDTNDTKETFRSVDLLPGNQIVLKVYFVKGNQVLAGNPIKWDTAAENVDKSLIGSEHLPIKLFVNKSALWIQQANVITFVSVESLQSLAFPSKPSEK